MSNQTPLISAEQVAVRLGRTKARVYEMARENLLPCVRLGRALAFDPGAIDRWIAGGGSALPGGWRKEPAE
ncbi:MAG: helix-turn-helix domain-containing protein [Gemmatimonadetes bacterium]|nr:helix-turn-helix domain-containing protein [Gemmatimonadota bacterium]